MKKYSSVGFQIILLQLLFTDQLFAYIDIGTLSAFLQLILAGIIGFIVYARNYITHYFRKFIQLFSKNSKNK